uniref:Uncharacterized protein n=1 Tax=Glossina brevipalpis TaxID=37001 RepID=A0A1A9W4D1_9MUSC
MSTCPSMFNQAKIVLTYKSTLFELLQMNLDSRKMWRYRILILILQILLHFITKQAQSAANSDIQVNKSLFLPYVLKTNVQGNIGQQSNLHYIQEDNKRDQRGYYTHGIEMASNASRIAEYQLGKANWNRVATYTNPANNLLLGSYLAGSDRWINYQDNLPYPISTPICYPVVLITLLITNLAVASYVIFIAASLFPRLLAFGGTALSLFHDFLKYNCLEIPAL